MAPSTSRTASSDAASPTTTSSGKSSPSRLMAKDEEDALIPLASDVSRTFLDGKETWNYFLNKAMNIPSGLWPAGMLDPYLALSNAPALPETLPRRNVFHGRPHWRMDSCTPGQHDMWDSELVPGRRVDFCLGVPDPITCEVDLGTTSFFLGNSTEMTNSLAVLTICWSYILSIRLLEMQGRQVQYSAHRLWPQETEHCEQPVVKLDGASPALIRWLCAILCPDLGWSVLGKGLLPPWTASLTGNIRLVTAVQVPMAGSRRPPSSSEATKLLIEMCQLFGLGTDMNNDERWESPSPYKAAFLAALMLPFYRFMDLHPRFPTPRLNTTNNVRFNKDDKKVISQYERDLRYFMTLSMHPPSVGSSLWSIFWQPNIECHLVSPWLASILDTLGPSIEALELETLVKVFVSRRPRVALWWLALFMLGDLSVVSWIQRYTTTLEEKYGFGSLSPPDPTVSAWTGSKQSFLDCKRTTSYPRQSSKVSKADLLRCRFNFKLQDSASTLLAWRPFGHVDKLDVEPDLWPCLENTCSRHYHSFIWCSPGKSYPASYGFRQDTGRDIKQVYDDLKLRSSGEVSQLTCHHDLRLAPSKTCTLRMISFLVEDAAGGRHSANAAMPGIFEHRWLCDWEGLKSFDAPELGADIAKKEPSWFLRRWVEGDNGERI